MENGVQPNDGTPGAPPHSGQTPLQSDHPQAPSERDIAARHNEQVEKNIKRFIDHLPNSFDMFVALADLRPFSL
jgi:hypothetical protein